MGKTSIAYRTIQEVVITLLVAIATLGAFKLAGVGIMLFVAATAKNIANADESGRTLIFMIVGILIAAGSAIVLINRIAGIGRRWRNRSRLAAAEARALRSFPSRGHEPTQFHDQFGH